MPLIHAERALELVGTRFKLQGRDRTGVDCLGVVVLVFDLPADALPDDYRLRGRGFGQVIDQAGQYFRRILPCSCRPGDLLLLAPRDDQVHFAVQTKGGFVHAHAGLRCVVETPGDPDWPVMAVFRRHVRERIF